MNKKLSIDIFWNLVPETLPDMTVSVVTEF
jgi:hypothetical protein